MASDDTLEQFRLKYDPTPTLQDVRIAEGVVLQAIRNCHPNPALLSSLVADVVTQCATMKFAGFPVAQTEPPEIVSAHIRWAAATAHALDALHSAGLVKPRKPTSVETIQSNMTYRTARQAGPIDPFFPEWDVYREWVLTIRSAATGAEQDFLFEPDLFLEKADLEGAHSRVRRSLVEAVNAYRQELYLAAATMIGSASEGAWVEFFDAYNAKAHEHGHKSIVIEGDLVRQVLKLPAEYSNIAGLRETMDRAGVTKIELAGVVQRYDYFRDVRNYAVHFDTTEKFDLTYSGVGVMLLDAARYFSTIYRMVRAMR